MKKTIIVIVLILMVVGNVYQALNPRVEIKERIVEVEKIVTKIKTKIKIVKIYSKSGTLLSETTTDDSTTETDSDIFKDTDKQTKSLPLPLNGTYLAINPASTTDLQLIQTRKIFGALEMVATGQVDLASIATQFDGKIYLGLGIKY